MQSLSKWSKILIICKGSPNSYFIWKKSIVFMQLSKMFNVYGQKVQGWDKFSWSIVKCFHFSENVDITALEAQKPKGWNTEDRIYSKQIYIAMSQAIIANVTKRKSQFYCNITHIKELSKSIQSVPSTSKLWAYKTQNYTLNETVVCRCRHIVCKNRMLLQKALNDILKPVGKPR